MCRIQYCGNSLVSGGRFTYSSNKYLLIPCCITCICSIYPLWQKESWENKGEHNWKVPETGRSQF